VSKDPPDLAWSASSIADSLAGIDDKLGRILDGTVIAAELNRVHVQPAAERAKVAELQEKVTELRTAFVGAVRLGDGYMHNEAMAKGNACVMSIAAFFPKVLDAEMRRAILAKTGGEAPATQPKCSLCNDTGEVPHSVSPIGGAVDYFACECRSAKTEQGT